MTSGEPAGVGPERLIAQVEAAGYTATLPRPPAGNAEPPGTADDPDPSRASRVMKAMLMMKKIEIEALEKAYAGVTV